MSLKRQIQLNKMAGKLAREFARAAYAGKTALACWNVHLQLTANRSEIDPNVWPKRANFWHDSHSPATRGG